VLITPLREKIALMIQNNSTELTTTQSSISSTQQAIQTFDQSVRQQEDSIRSLESKMSDTRVVRDVTGAVVTQSLSLPSKFTDISASLACSSTFLLLAWQH
jgi:predicted  nucleic acid-binding Zn-ribbon protein